MATALGKIFNFTVIFRLSIGEREDFISFRRFYLNNVLENVGDINWLAVSALLKDFALLIA